VVTASLEFVSMTMTSTCYTGCICMSWIWCN